MFSFAFTNDVEMGCRKQRIADEPGRAEPSLDAAHQSRQIHPCLSVLILPQDVVEEAYQSELFVFKRSVNVIAAETQTMRGF